MTSGRATALLMAMMLTPAVQAQQAPASAEAASAGVEQVSGAIDQAAASAALATLDAFMVAFNDRDLDAWEATFSFPHFRLADGTLTVLPAAGARTSALFDALAATGWHHSAWLSREVVQAGPDKAHVVVEFARYRADESELARYRSLYVMTREQGRWGIRGRSSFAP